MHLVFLSVKALRTLVQKSTVAYAHQGGSQSTAQLHHGTSTRGCNWSWTGGNPYCKAQRMNVLEVLSHSCARVTAESLQLVFGSLSLFLRVSVLQYRLRPAEWLVLHFFNGSFFVLPSWATFKIKSDVLLIVRAHRANYLHQMLLTHHIFVFIAVAVTRADVER